MTIYCFNCQEQYDSGKSTAKEHSEMYCSQECEDEDTARLVEGNGIIANAEANNPLAFGRTNIELAKQTLQTRSTNIGSDINIALRNVNIKQD